MVAIESIDIHHGCDSPWPEVVGRSGAREADDPARFHPPLNANA
jgi:hypothetical protein